MSFLDRFKIQPKHKSPDPEIRLASVPELGAEEGDEAVLVALATEDADARVRRAAAARIDDVGVLVRIAGSDADAGLREELLGRLAGRAKSKSVAKRARAMVQAIDEAEAARKAALEQHQQKVAGAVARVEALAAATTMAGAEDQLAAAVADWNAIVATATHEISSE